MRAPLGFFKGTAYRESVPASRNLVVFFNDTATTEISALSLHDALPICMKLDCDPTTIYAALLQQNYRGTIYRSNLDSEHPYNTYRHSGLPPGPISNPGLASIRAALAPSESDSLYFVARADGSGGHEFSANIAAHEIAVERYRRALHK